MPHYNLYLVSVVFRSCWRSNNGVENWRRSVSNRTTFPNLGLSVIVISDNYLMLCVLYIIKMCFRSKREECLADMEQCLLSPHSFLSRSAVALDLSPALREIARFEQVRFATQTKRSNRCVEFSSSIFKVADWDLSFQCLKLPLHHGAVLRFGWSWVWILPPEFVANMS